MTIDEQGHVIPVNLENTDMIRNAVHNFGNMLVEASYLAKEVRSLREELEAVKNQIAVTNEAAKRAFEERDAAVANLRRAEEQRDMADQAYAQVNAQRITAENELHVVRVTSGTMQASAEFAAQQLSEAQARIASLEADQDKVLKMADDDIAAANAKANRRVAEVETILEALRLEVAALKDDRTRLQDELALTYVDVRSLRSIINEAKLANAAVTGVLSGQIAAE